MDEIENQIKAIAEKLAAERGFSGIKIEVEADNSVFNTASYIHPTKTIYINTPLFIADWQKSGDKLEDFIELLICHELGHANDPKMDELYKAHYRIYSSFWLRYDHLGQYWCTKEDTLKLLDELSQLQIQLEISAWKHGKRFVSSRLAAKFDAFNMKNITKYEKDHAELRRNITEFTSM